MQKRLSLSIDEKIWKKYNEFCKRSGCKISPRIQVLIEKDLESMEKK